MLTEQTWRLGAGSRGKAGSGEASSCSGSSQASQGALLRLVASGTSVRRGSPAEDDTGEAAGAEASTDQGWTLSVCHRQVP